MLRRPSFAVLATALALLSGGPSLAVESGAFRYTKPQQGVYSISPADLVPEGTDAHTAQFSRSAIYLSIGKAPGDADCMLAGLHLPQGARLTRVVTTLESGAHYDPFFRVLGVEFARGYGYNIAFYSAKADDSATRRVRAVNFSGGTRVDNGRFMYQYEVCLGYQDVFYGARVYYDYFTAGD